MGDEPLYFAVVPFSGGQTHTDPEQCVCVCVCVLCRAADCDSDREEENIKLDVTVNKWHAVLYAQLCFVAPPGGETML